MFSEEAREKVWAEIELENIGNGDRIIQYKIEPTKPSKDLETHRYSIVNFKALKILDYGKAEAAHEKDVILLE